MNKPAKSPCSASRKWIIPGAVIFILTLTISLFYHQHRLHEFLTYGTDSLGYYQFLPAFFIQHQLESLPWAVFLDNGNNLSIFQIGVALLILPFFLIAHLFSLVFGWEPTGYSAPYAVAVLTAGAFYAAAGISLLIKYLSGIFSYTNSVLTVMLIYTGTNLYYYSFREPGMSHVYSFFLFSALIFLTGYFEKHRNWRVALLLSVVSANILLIKPNNGIILFFFLFYNVTGFKSFGKRLRFAFLPFYTWIPGIVAALAMVSLQLGYWYHVSGKWILYTYGTKNEGFDWLHPKLLYVLFHPQNGWLLYSPIMIIAMIGLVYLAVKNKLNGRVSLIIWVLAWYIFSSWWAWWFGGAYGHRAFVEYYALLSVPMAFILHSAKNKSLRLYLSLLALCFFFVWVNLNMTFNYAWPWDGPDWGWDNYFEVLNNAI